MLAFGGLSIEIDRIWSILSNMKPWPEQRVSPPLCIRIFFFFKNIKHLNSHVVTEEKPKCLSGKWLNLQWLRDMPKTKRSSYWKSNTEVRSRDDLTVVWIILMTRNLININTLWQKLPVKCKDRLNDKNPNTSFIFKLDISDR